MSHDFYEQTKAEPQALVEYAPKCIHELFEEQVERTPDAPAVIFAKGGGKVRCELTYGELNARSNQLAHHLQALGVGPEVLVGICVERSPAMVVGLLAILKAGGAYVPLDPAYPKERLAFMLRDAQVHVLLTTDALVAKLRPYTTAEIVALDALHLAQQKVSAWDSADPSCLGTGLNVSMTLDNLAYVIYTSGSTGRPKGVEGLHRGAVNRFHWMWDTYPFEAGEVACQKTSLSFVDSIGETFGPLLRGVPLVIANDAAAKDPQQLVQLLADEDVTRIIMVPSLLRAFLDMFPDLASRLPKLRHWISGGEVLPIELFERFQKVMPGCTLINLYGSSEASADATWYDSQDFDPSFNLKSIPIGRPITNMQVYILDADLQPVPTGSSGDIYVGGAGLARGYKGRPELTLERFIPNPFRAGRLYKTGDLGRYLPDGNIEYLGRSDHQVKIRGFRIELGEIETALVQHPAVRQAIVVARENERQNENGHGDKRLVAYVVPQSGATASSSSEPLAEQVTQWQQVWDAAYLEPARTLDPTFNIVGWNDSYTGLPIPAPQMREWVDYTVERILTWQPKRVLEIGCGSGMLLFQIAPHCTSYVGTDISGQALHYVKQQMEQIGGLEQVTLLKRAAEAFSGLESDGFDAVIINSVVQYFPNVEYLLTVLEGAISKVAPGGIIFVGDVRNLQLLEALHAAVESARVPGSLSREKLRQQVQNRISKEEELLIDPELFMALSQRFPQISHVDIQLERGRHHNDMTQFRYDVTLHVGKEGPRFLSLSKDAHSPLPQWLDWQANQLTLSQVRQILVESKPESLGIRGVPNARILKEIKIWELLGNYDGPATVGELREVLSSEGGALSESAGGVDPEAWWAFEKELPYTVHVNWSEGEAKECVDVLCVRKGQDGLLPHASRHPRPAKAIKTIKPWAAYANNPLRGKMARWLEPKLRSHLAARFPDYMVPAAFVVLDAMPLTPNGKINRHALPAPGTVRPQLETALVMPQSESEQLLATIWQEALQLDTVGIHDNFFDLGGHSLLLTQVYRKLVPLFPKIPIVAMFQNPTIHTLAKQLSQLSSGQMSSQPAIKQRTRRRTRKANVTQQKERRRQAQSKRKRWRDS